MRRISKINRSIDLLGASSTRTPSKYLCVTCQNHANTFSTTTTKAKEGGFFSTENLRKKIWGTDNPPGQKDPYTKLDKNEAAEQEASKGEIAAAEEVKEEKDYPTDRKSIKRSIAQQLRPERNYKKPTYLFGMEVVGDSVLELRADQSFKAFIPETIEKAPAVLTMALHRAVVEIFALKRAEKPLNSISKEAPCRELDWTKDVAITPTREGATLVFPERDTLRSILQELASPSSSNASEEAPVQPTESQEDVDADRSPVDPLQPTEKPVEHELPEDRKPQPTESEEDVAADRSKENPLRNANTNRNVLSTEAVVESWGTTWLKVPIEDLEVKFAIIKRMMQLTGARFPDSAIQSAKSVETILSHLIKPPKPTKLAEALTQNPELLNLPNVSISQHKVTYHDKERNIGRQKLVRAELMARGLPVFANNGRRVEWKSVPTNNQSAAVSK
ncbi:hypothetical protein HYFRA_00008854 [Hymenoscyphus fraxineus]|uniref:Large ribosomal subunit protein mL50 n=1 Tax=Hymenoscyphus fraxineus TaxID=746836 RepID=A0A9N9L0C9_9HELO|nr:hypothetical protein HYFRA_00008854 [Hymenoscyphus fraxineus]